jgi:hypothetical protein
MAGGFGFEEPTLVLKRGGLRHIETSEIASPGSSERTIIFSQTALNLILYFTPMTTIKPSAQLGVVAPGVPDELCVMHHSSVKQLLLRCGHALDRSGNLLIETLLFKN